MLERDRSAILLRFILKQFYVTNKAFLEGQATETKKDGYCYHLGS